MNKFLVFALPVMATGLLFSCGDNDSETGEDVWERITASSSSFVSNGFSSSSSSLQSGSVPCRYATGCAEIPADACISFGGTIVASCPVGSSSSLAVVSSSSSPFGVLSSSSISGSSSSSFAGVSSSSPVEVLSSSSISGSSSSLQSGLVFCMSAVGCAEMSVEACIAFGGTIVESCPIIGSSSSLASSSSLFAVVSSSSGISDNSSSSNAVLSSSSSSEMQATPSSSSVVPSSSSYVGCSGFVEGTEREHYGKMKKQFCDVRDGKKYVYVVIGTQTWMAENLNYEADGSVCYSNSENNCTKYGHLYDWSMAMAVCPSGWHLPTQAEWNTLSNYVQSNCSNCDATKLKAEDGWNNNGNGTDDYKFSALPGGGGDFGGSSFANVESIGNWWSADEDGGGYNAYGRYMHHDKNIVDKGISDKRYLFSVRCVKD